MQHEPAFPRLAPLLRAVRRSWDDPLALIVGLLALPFIIALFAGFWQVLLIALVLGFVVFLLLALIGACL